MALLPPISSDAELGALRKDTATCTAALRAVARAEGLPAQDVALYSEGSVLVGAAGDTVIKLFPPMDGAHIDAEARVLAHLAGRLPVPTPALLGRGELQGWPYLLMSRLRGRHLSDLWPTLPQGDRAHLCDQIGALVAALHGLPLAGLGPLDPDWTRFIDGQLRGCAERQRARKLEERWARQIDPFLAEVPLPEEPPALLHTEVMPAHLCVVEEGRAFRLSGLLDFEPATVGAPSYEFASLGIFLAQGDPALLARLQGAYAQSGGDLGDPAGRPRRLLAYALLHRYSRLCWYLSLLPHEGAQTLEDLAERWFSC